MNQQLDKILADFLIEGDSDYIGLWQVVGRISKDLGIKDTTRLSHESSEKILAATLDFVSIMLKNGFEIVNLAAKGGCVAWPDQSIEYISQTITLEWRQHEGNLGYVGFNFWFHKVNPGSIAVWL